MKNTASTPDLPALPTPPSTASLRKLENELVQILRSGLVQAGIETGRRLHGMFVVELDQRVGIWLKSYDIDLRWWRITWGYVTEEDYTQLIDGSELTLHRDEFNEQTGVEFAKLLRDGNYRWPLFDGERNYPRYGWTKLARDTYTEFRLLREAHQDARRKGGSR